MNSLRDPNLLRPKAYFFILMTGTDRTPIDHIVIENQMRFAIVDGNKSEPAPKLRGVCSHCESEMIAKCGRVKVWHWAHKGRPPCDPWWESETQWHRDWKNCFPSEWQEVSHLDPTTGEIHIADVKNPLGLVIEFQHSPIKPEELKSREQFYGQMIWVVNGLRGELDEGWFNMGLSGPIQKNPLAYQVQWFGQSHLLHNWSLATAKVYLDFGKDHLWRLVLFDHKRKIGAVSPIAKTAFIEDCLRDTEISVSFMPEDASDSGLL
jgi:competence protein CoiA